MSQSGQKWGIEKKEAKAAAEEGARAYSSGMAHKTIMPLSHVMVLVLSSSFSEVVQPPGQAKMVSPQPIEQLA